MSTGISNSIRRFFKEETFKERSERMLPAVMLGLIAGTVYVLVRSTINVLTLPALHLSLDWTRLLTNLIVYDLVLALGGAIAGWFTDDSAGAVGGGILTTLLYLVYTWISFRINGVNQAQVVQFVITLIPILIGAMLLCAIFRFAVNRYLRIKQMDVSENRKSRMAGFIAIVIAVGLIPGLFSRFDGNDQKAILTMEQRLGAAASDPSLLSQFPLAQFPDLQAHFGLSFTLSPRSSSELPSALDVTIRYSDGYTLTCLIPTNDPYVQYFKQCTRGKNVVLPSSN